MAVARTKPVIFQRARHSIDVGDDPMEQDFCIFTTERPAFGWSLLSEGLAPRPKPRDAETAKEQITHPLARDRQGGRQGVSHATA